MPDLFCPKADGGLFDAPGRLDIFNCFRRPDEASMAGGVFIVVECKDKKSWQVLKAKGHPIGATGVSMHAISAMQLVGEAGEVADGQARVAVVGFGRRC